MTADGIHAIMEGNHMNRLNVKQGLLSVGVILIAFLSLSACGEPSNISTIQNDYRITLDCGNYKDFEAYNEYNYKAKSCLRVDKKATGIYVLDAADNNTGADMKVKILIKNNDGPATVFKKASSEKPSGWVPMRKR
jgi:hypothetical protein